MNIVSRGQLLGQRFGHAEIDDLRRRLAVHFGNQNVGGFQVAVDDRLLVRVLHAFADVHEKLEPFAGAEPVIVAVGRDGHPGDVFHHEVRRALRRRAGIEHLGDGRVVHHGESLALRLEARDHFAGVHPGLDQLERDAAAHRFFLLRQPDLAHAAFPDSLEQVIAANHRPQTTFIQGRGRVSVEAFFGRHVYKTPLCGKCLRNSIHPIRALTAWLEFLRINPFQQIIVKQIPTGGVALTDHNPLGWLFNRRCATRTQTPEIRGSRK